MEVGQQLAAGARSDQSGRRKSHAGPKSATKRDFSSRRLSRLTDASSLHQTSGAVSLEGTVSDLSNVGPGNGGGEEGGDPESECTHFLSRWTQDQDPLWVWIKLVKVWIDTFKQAEMSLKYSEGEDRNRWAAVFALEHHQKS